MQPCAQREFAEKVADVLGKFLLKISFPGGPNILNNVQKWAIRRKISKSVIFSKANISNLSMAGRVVQDEGDVTITCLLYSALHEGIKNTGCHTSLVKLLMNYASNDSDCQDACRVGT